MNVKTLKKTICAAFLQLLGPYFGVDAHFLSDSVDEKLV